MAYYTKLPIVLLSELAADTIDYDAMERLVSELLGAKRVAVFGLLKAETASHPYQLQLAASLIAQCCGAKLAQISSQPS